MSGKRVLYGVVLEGEVLVVWSLLESVDLLPFVVPMILLNGIEGLERNEKDSLMGQRVLFPAPWQCIVPPTRV